MNTLSQQAEREKYWGEKSDQEKIIILGEIVDALTKKVVDLEKTMVDVLQHTHSASGEVVVPLRRTQSEIPYWMTNPLRREPK